MSKTVFLLRHAEPKVLNGKRGGLTENGELQAKLAGNSLQSQDLFGNLHVLYSPVLRCEETASIIAKLCDSSLSVGKFRLKGAARLLVPNGESKYSIYLKSFKKLGIESPIDYSIRVLKLIEKNKADNVIIVMNEVGMRILLQKIGGRQYNRHISYAECFKLSIDNTKGIATVIPMETV